MLIYVIRLHDSKALVAHNICWWNTTDNEPEMRYAIYFSTKAAGEMALPLFFFHCFVDIALDIYIYIYIYASNFDTLNTYLDRIIQFQLCRLINDIYIKFIKKNNFISKSPMYLLMDYHVCVLR